MRYSDTWFSKQPMTMQGSWGNGRQLWLHQYVDVITGGPYKLVDMEIHSVLSGISLGSHDRKKMQHSLLLHANRLKEAGATIVKQTKNSLIARHGNETAYFVMSETGAATYFNNLRKAG